MNNPTRIEIERFFTYKKVTIANGTISKEIETNPEDTRFWYATRCFYVGQSFKITSFDFTKYRIKICYDLNGVAKQPEITSATSHLFNQDINCDGNLILAIRNIQRIYPTEEDIQLSNLCIYADYENVNHPFMYVPHTAKLLSMDAKEGMTFRTGGYEEEGDDGGLLFQICKNRAECEGNSNRIYPEMIYRENGGTIREFPNGLFAVSRTPVQQVRIECFGAKCKKGEDDSDAFRLYAEWCKKNRAYLIKLPPKKIRISGTFSFLPEVPDSNEHTNFLPRIIGESGSFPGNASINSEEGTGTLIIDISEPEGQGEPTAEPLFAITGPDKQNGNGLEIRNVSFFCSNNNAFKCAIHIFNGGTDCVIQNVQIRNFKGGGLHLNNTFDLQCSGLAVKECGNNVLGTAAVRLYGEREGSANANTNGCHFSNFHFEGREKLLVIEHARNNEFSCGKIEAFINEQNEMSSSAPWVEIKEGCGETSFTGVFFKTPSTANAIKALYNVIPGTANATTVPYFMTVANSVLPGSIRITGCTFTSEQAGSKVFAGETVSGETGYAHGLSVVNCLFNCITDGTTAIKVTESSFVGNTFRIFPCSYPGLYNSGFWSFNGGDISVDYDNATRGCPIIVGNGCLFHANRFGYHRRQQEHYPAYIFEVRGQNNDFQGTMTPLSDESLHPIPNIFKEEQPDV